MNSTNTLISLSHTEHDRVFVRDVYRGMECRFVPQVWGLVPLGYVNSPLAIYNHWTGLVDWTGGLDWWTDTKNHFYDF